MSFEILAVCTGNICRSAMAHKLFEYRLAGYPDITISSAGTHGLVGDPMDPPSAQALRELGVDPDGHVARRLDESMIAQADLILTATTGHIDVVLRMVPSAMRRAFTLREFPLLAGNLAPVGEPVGRHARRDDRDAVAEPADPDVLRARVALVAAQRGQAPIMGRSEVNIGDPYGATIEVARRCALAVSDAVNADIAALGLTPRT